jgi:hypothetical protein
MDPNTTSNSTSSNNSKNIALNDIKMPGLFLSANSIQRVRSARGKVALKPGYSTLDWANLKSSGKNLRVSIVKYNSTIIFYLI